MSKSRRRKHQELVSHQQFRKVFRRTMQELHDTGKGPWSPGPWWPEGHPKHIPGEVWLGSRKPKPAPVRHHPVEEWDDEDELLRVCSHCERILWKDERHVVGQCSRYGRRAVEAR